MTLLQRAHGRAATLEVLLGKAGFLPDHFTSVLCGAVLTALFASSRAACAQGPPYTFTKIQFPGSLSTKATGINNSGQVVGTYTTSDGKAHGFVFDGTTYATIDFPGASFSYAFGIGASGQIVGSYSSAAAVGPYHGFLWDTGTFSSFDFPDRETDGRAINASGQIAGIYNSGFGTPDHGYVKSGDSYTAIDYPGAAHTYAVGLNDAGRITGTYRDAAGGGHGFIRFGDAFFPIEFPGATHTAVGAINNLDAMAGTTQQGASLHGFVLAGAGFRSFDVDFTGVTGTMAVAINDLGQVAGTYEAPDCPGGCGFLATPRGDIPPICDQTLSLAYSAGTLTVGFELATAVPLTWTVSLAALNASVTLWSVPMPTVSPMASFDLLIPGVGPIGTVIAFSTLRTASGHTVCVDFATVNTGSGLI